MEPAQFLTAPRVTIVAGKGGVGKTTVVATIALAAARLGLKALVVEVEGKSGLSSLFGKPALEYDDAELYSDPSGGAVRARTLTPDETLVEYLGQAGLKRISKRLVESGAIDMVATATPGIKDVLILGKVKQLERSGVADVIVVDAPAAGHAISFLSSAQGLLDAVDVGRIEAQAREVVELLNDASRCQVVLVTLAEETPVNELIETAYSLEDRIGIKLGPVVVNATLPEIEGLGTGATTAAKQAGVTLTAEEASTLDAAATFRAERQRLQRSQLDRLARDLPLPQVQLPLVFSSELDLPSMLTLSDAMTAQIAELDGVVSGA